MFSRNKKKNRSLRNYTRLCAIAICSSIVFYACTQNSEIKLKLTKTEALIEEFPDSALSIINTIQADAISRQSDRAKYALLKSFAQYKNYIDVDNDSLPAQALAYYRGKGNKEEMISLFMNAEKANEAKFYEESLALDLEGLNCAEKLNDTLFIARFHQLAGSLYDNTYKRTESSKHYHKAYEYFELAGKSIHALFSLYDYAVALIGLSQFQEAQQIFFRIQESTDSFDLCNLKANAIGGLMRIDMETGDWESVLYGLIQESVFCFPDKSQMEKHLPPAIN